jgi:hypothetical protein
MRCSRGEGGHGLWKWNKPVGMYGNYYLKDWPNRPPGSSGAGGPMQFLESTYYGYSDEAFARAEKRGLNIPSQFNHWYSLLGQAVTAAYIRDRSIDETHQHWAPSIDAGCY